MNKINILFDKVDKFFFILSQIAVLIIMLLTTFDALARYIFKQPILGAFELTEKYLMVIVVFLGMSYVMKLDGHIKVELLGDRLSERSKKILDALFLVFGFLFMVGIGYQSMTATYEAFVNNYTTSGIIQWPTWLSIIWVSIGSYLFAIRMILIFINQILMLKKTVDYEGATVKGRSM